MVIKIRADSKTKLPVWHFCVYTLLQSANNERIEEFGCRPHWKVANAQTGKKNWIRVLSRSWLHTADAAVWYMRFFFVPYDFTRTIGSMVHARPCSIRPAQPLRKSRMQIFDNRLTYCFLKKAPDCNSTHTHWAEGTWKNKTRERKVNLSKEKRGRGWRWWIDSRFSFCVVSYCLVPFILCVLLLFVMFSRAHSSSSSSFTGLGQILTFPSSV